jgi:penicillin-binding protein 2
MKAARFSKPLITLIALVFLGLYANLFGLQVLSSKEYQSKARIISRQRSILPAERGEIYDSGFEKVLASNTYTFAVSVTPALVPKDYYDDAVQYLASSLGMTIDAVRRKLPQSSLKDFGSVQIASGLGFETIARIAEQSDEHPWLSWSTRPMRIYMYPTLFSHLLGYIGEITQDELYVLANKGYARGDIIGKDGVERQYDQYLKGTDGYEFINIDARGRRLSGQETSSVIAPKQGASISLTIDAEMQTLARKALGNKPGAVVIMNPNDGAILALVSYPEYDPNALITGLSDTEYLRYAEDPRKPFWSRYIRSAYPPASTFKMIMTTAIIEENAFPPEQKIKCTGKIQYGDRVFNCWYKLGHGDLDLAGALANSCDVYYWTVGRDYLGDERISHYAREFGLGQPTGIDLPGEVAGFVPTRAWKESTLHEKWLGGDTMNMSIGQGYTLITPVQMADVVALIANDGIVYKPHVLQEMRDSQTGAIIKKAEPEVLFTSRISKESFSAVKKDMRGVVSQGTARFAMTTRAVSVAGKTGTSETGQKDRFHNWFVSYGPFEEERKDERVVVCVLIEANDMGWDSWTTRSSNIIYQGIFAKQTYEEAIKALGVEALTIQVEAPR